MNQKVQKHNFFFFFLPTILITSCVNTYSPKPRGYYRIDFPVKQYMAYSSSNCPYTFEIPVYAEAHPDSSSKAEPCWMNIVFPAYKGCIHLSYKKIKGNLSEYIEDSRTFAYKHTVKADAIEERILHYADRQVYGILYDIKGNAASSVQFFVTDSTMHFIRGALYFSCTPNKDSLSPVIHFFREDIVHLLETLQWKQ